MSVTTKRERLKHLYRCKGICDFAKEGQLLHSAFRNLVCNRRYLQKRRDYREARESGARYQGRSDPSRLPPPGRRRHSLCCFARSRARDVQTAWPQRPASGGLGVGGLPSAKMVHHSGSIQSFRHQKGRWQPSGSGAARGALRSGGVRCPHAAAALRRGSRGALRARGLPAWVRDCGLMLVAGTQALLPDAYKRAAVMGGGTEVL